MKKSRTVLMVIILLASTSALSTDGVVEINHICATQLGCFSGDTVNYPVRINGTAGKSYRLTSDLIIPDENTNGIDVASSNISIDLNGFSIVRSGCENTITDCTSLSGTGKGISTGNTAYFGLSVKNGSIIGMGERGISHIGSGGRFEKLNIRWSRDYGIGTGLRSILTDSIVSNNGGSGVFLGEGSIARNNTVSFNNNDGIDMRSGAMAINNTVNNNATNGINASLISGPRLIKDNTVYLNNEFGIICRGSIASFNKINSNGDSGMFISEGCNAQENSIHDNTGFGITVSTASNQKMNVLQRNIIIDNTLGTIDGTHYFSFGKNFCETDDVCP